MSQKIKPGHVLVEVVEGVEGPSLSIGDNDTGERVAGPKPWGGGRTIHCFQVSANDLIRLAKEYAGAEPSAPKCKACGDTGVIDDKAKDELPTGHFVERGLVACKQCEEPSAPVEPTVLDDRTSFEAEFPVPFWAEWSDAEQSYLKSEDHICSATALAMYRQAWKAWQGGRAGLTTWKRRAIEAESKLRTYDPSLLDLGAQVMDALFVEPKPKEFVLTKCKLCDQLQADLTARDELIDALSLDAGRYRWLRQRHLPLDGHDFLSTQEVLDRRIDAAMAKEAQS